MLHKRVVQLTALIIVMLCIGSVIAALVATVSMDAPSGRERLSSDDVVDREQPGSFRIVNNCGSVVRSVSIRGRDWSWHYESEITNSLLVAHPFVGDADLVFTITFSFHASSSRG